MNRTEAFNSHRPYLFSIAYRMLGSVMDAEDMVQETYLRWDKSSVRRSNLPKPISPPSSRGCASIT